MNSSFSTDIAFDDKLPGHYLTEKCTKCGSYMVEREIEQGGSTGTLVICSSYPKCRHHWHNSITGHPLLSKNRVSSTAREKTTEWLHERPITFYVAFITAAVILITLLGYVLPTWFYFNAPFTRLETTYDGKKVLFDSGKSIKDENGNLRGISLQEYWIPGFYSWTKYSDSTLIIYSPSYIKKR